MKRYKRILAVFLSVLMLSATSLTTALAEDILESETEQGAEMLVAGMPMTRNAETAEAVFAEDVPEIGGESTGITVEAIPITDPEFKSPTGIIGDFGDSSDSSIDPLAVDDLTVIKGSALFRESKVGAHYYAFSAYSASYTSAFANIQLPTGFNNGGSLRNGFVCLGIYGSNHGIDLGLINKGGGWVPYHYDVGHGSAYTYPDTYMAPPTATNAIITVKPVNTTTVHMYVQFTNSAGSYVGTPLDTDIRVSAGNLTTASNGRINCRFYRFASLVPYNDDNQSDGTYMTGGRSLYCQLYNGSSYVGWGKDSSTMQNVWKISSDKISLSFAGNNDTYSIRHQ